MLNAASMLGAVFRRCNAVLTGGLNGVDAMGEKVSDGVIENHGGGVERLLHWVSWAGMRIVPRLQI